MAKKSNIQEFIEKARNIHGNKYDYSKVEYKNNYTKVCIICPTHGEFWQTPNSHLSGRGCRLCNFQTQSSNRRRDLTDFVKRAQEIHGDRYDYSKAKYVNNKTKVCIICPEHGEFWQTPYAHINLKRQCPKCSLEKHQLPNQSIFNAFIEKAKKIHDDKYDYSKVVYKNKDTKVCIICPEHGEFWQTPETHNTYKCGCPKCAQAKRGLKRRLSTEQFIEKAREIHGDKYDYSKVEYRKSNQKICIICPIHGEFWQTPNSHLNGSGCPSCYGTKQSTTEQFIEKAKAAHGGKYDYSKVEYKRCNSKVCIICQEHGEFWQKASNHLRGDGCPKCNQSQLEREVMAFLKNNSIEYIYQYKNKPLLGKQSLDFYLPKYNVAIECQGEQHFKPIKHFGGEMKFEQTVRRDKTKSKILQENKIRLLYFTRKDFLPLDFGAQANYITTIEELKAILQKY